MTTKKTTKEKVKEQDKKDEFIEIAKDLKEIILNLNQRVSEMEAVFERIRTRLGI